MTVNVVEEEQEQEVEEEQAPKRRGVSEFLYLCKSIQASYSYVDKQNAARSIMAFLGDQSDDE